MLHLYYICFWYVLSLMGVVLFLSQFPLRGVPSNYLLGLWYAHPNQNQRWVYQKNTKKLVKSLFRMWRYPTGGALAVFAKFPKHSLQSPMVSSKMCECRINLRLLFMSSNMFKMPEQTIGHGESGRTGSEIQNLNMKLGRGPTTYQETYLHKLGNKTFTFLWISNVSHHVSTNHAISPRPLTEPGSAVKVTESNKSSSLAMRAMPSGTPTPKFTTHFGVNSLVVSRSHPPKVSSIWDLGPWEVGKIIISKNTTWGGDMWFFSQEGFCFINTFLFWWLMRIEYLAEYHGISKDFALGTSSKRLTQN